MPGLTRAMRTKIIREQGGYSRVFRGKLCIDITCVTYVELVINWVRILLGATQVAVATPLCFFDYFFGYFAFVDMMTS